MVAHGGQCLASPPLVKDENTAASTEFHNKQFEQYDAKPVRIVRDATISEISLVPDGACREAYCLLIDKRECGPLLSDDVKSKRVLADGGYANMMRALRKLDSKLN